MKLRRTVKSTLEVLLDSELPLYRPTLRRAAVVCRRLSRRADAQQETNKRATQADALSMKVKVMPIGKLLPGEYRSVEYVLSGPRWGVMLACATCTAAAAFESELPVVAPPGSVWSALQCGYPARQDIVVLALAALAALTCFWSFAHPWLARRVVLLESGLAFYGSWLSSKAPLVIPYSYMHELRVTWQAAPMPGHRASASRSDDMLSFTFGRQRFELSKKRFRNAAEFEAFCTALSQRVTRVSA